MLQPPRRAWLALALLAVPACFYITEAERQDRWDLDGDGVERPGDCDDADPGVTELRTWYADADGDGFGDPDATIDDCTAPEGFVDRADDCDDGDPDTYPAAREICDGVDNDCNQQIDENQATFTWYRDADEDGVGDADDTVDDCAPPAGYVADAGDCDDGDPGRYLGAPELCDGIDQDCDDLDDLDDPDLSAADRSTYADVDGDGFGTGAALEECPPGPGRVLVDGDCDDTLPEGADRYPGADEVCNGFDDDCDGTPDNNDPIDGLNHWPDADGDGGGDADAVEEVRCADGDPAWVLNRSDCDDNEPTTYAGAPEVCGDGVDSNCVDGDTEVEPACLPPDTGGSG